ncbi:MAG: serine hydrolase [Caldilineaceae bacterium]|nr:serine hydrolase [Caldilineaceae bacterium]
MHASPFWQNLRARIQTQTDGFPGVAGIAVRDVTNGDGLVFNGGEVFPTASTIKIHVLLQLLARAERREVDLTEQIPIDLTNTVQGSGVLWHLTGPVTLSLRDIATLMIIASDNTATNICIDRAGIDATNGLLRSLGLEQTVLRRKMLDAVAAVADRENVSTPIELVRSLFLLHEGKPTGWAAEEALTILRKPKGGFIDRGLPAGTIFASKPGHVAGAFCDAALISLPRRPYALAVMTKYVQCSDRQVEAFIAQVTETVHRAMAVWDRSNGFGRIVYEE